MQAYLYGAGRIGADSTTWTYYHADALGSIHALSDDSGQPISVHAYSPYGDPTTAAPADFGYTGEQTGAGGLVYLRARYYDPGVGVFLSADPSRLEANLYAYVGGNPVNRVDPSGLCSSCYVFFFGGASFAGDEDGDGSVEDNLTLGWRTLVELIRAESGSTVHVLYPFAPGLEADGDRWLGGALWNDYVEVSRGTANSRTSDPLIRAKAAEITDFVLRTEYGLGDYHFASDCHYWSYLANYRLDHVTIDMVAYSAGGNIAYQTASELSVSVDSVVFLGAPVASSSDGIHTNIQDVVSLVGYADALQRGLQLEYGPQVGVTTCVLGRYELKSDGNIVYNNSIGHTDYVDTSPLLFSSIDCGGELTTAERQDVWASLLLGEIPHRYRWIEAGDRLSTLVWFLTDIIGIGRP